MLSVSFVVLIVTLLKSCCCPRATPAASMIPKKTSRLVCFMARTIDPPEANVRPSAAQPAGTDCSAAVEIRRGLLPGGTQLHRAIDEPGRSEPIATVPTREL